MGREVQGRCLENDITAAWDGALRCVLCRYPLGGMPAPYISWVIVGGESGPGARPFDLEWARSIRDQCKAAGTAFFMKQVGSNATFLGARYRTSDRAGADPAEWPEDLRVQEWPTV